MPQCVPTVPRHPGLQSKAATKSPTSTKAVSDWRKVREVKKGFLHIVKTNIRKSL